MSDIRALADDELRDRLRYQQAPGPHTMGIGTCQICGGDSRGSACFCRWCLEEEIKRRSAERNEP